MIDDATDKVVQGIVSLSEDQSISNGSIQPELQQDSPSYFNNTEYPGNLIDNTPPPDGTYQAFEFPDPAILVNFFDQSIADGLVTLYPWQENILLDLASAKPTQQNPNKCVVLASNGSGKDKFIIAPFAVWMTLTKIKARVIITTASGQQLTSQTEPYLKDLCEKVNNFYKTEIYRIRQRYIKCIKTGSEIRMFATDEAGKAEGFHPIEPNSEMAIIVNEGKTVTEEIHQALRRCTGFNYWLEISSAGEPKGFLYRAYNSWKSRHRITSYDCPHQSQTEIAEDKFNDGEDSAFFRSKHLSLFTTIEGQTVISNDLIEYLSKNPPKYAYPDWKRRIGLDLAAGGDENVVCITQGNKVLKEFWFRDKNTVKAAERISSFLTQQQIPKYYDHIYADDGGISRGIVDMLVDNHGWKNINRVMNQWSAIGNDKRYGNRGAQNWWRIKRILEEKFFDIRGMSPQTLEQLYTRKFRQSDANGKIYLQSKPEAKAEGHPSPDRADAFVLSLTGLTVEDFAKDNRKVVATEDAPVPGKPVLWHEAAKALMHKPEQVVANEFLEWYDQHVKFRDNEQPKPKSGSRIFNSLRRVLYD